MGLDKTESGHHAARRCRCRRVRCPVDVPTGRRRPRGIPFWWAFVKYGKLAPELHSHAVFKRPQVMLEPVPLSHRGALPKPFYGGPNGTAC